MLLKRKRTCPICRKRIESDNNDISKNKQDSNIEEDKPTIINKNIRNKIEMLLIENYTKIN